MKKVKLIPLILAFILLLGTLGACTGETPESSPGSGAATQPPSDPSETGEDPAPSEGQTGAGEETAITIWTWEPQENQQATIDQFNKDFPNINVQFSMVDSADMVKKLQLALSSGSDLPDVAWLEIAQRGKLIALDCWEDLSAAPYNVDSGLLLDFLEPLSTNERGELIGIESSPAGAGLVYKRDLAKQYLGTDDPAELQKMLASWDDVITVGQDVLEKSDNSVYMFVGIADVKQIVMNQYSAPFVADGKLNLKESIGGALQTMIDVKESGIADNMEQWSPAWNASFTTAQHIFYPCATWGLTWMVKANDPEGANVWGLMEAPGGGYTWGGTIHAIPKNAQNKDAAFEFIRWNYLTLRGAETNLSVNEYYTALKEAYADPEFFKKPDDYFGGQDVMGMFAYDIMPQIDNVRPINEFDMEVNDAINLATSTITASDGGLTVDTLLADMQQDILNKVPDLEGE